MKYFQYIRDTKVLSLSVIFAVLVTGCGGGESADTGANTQFASLTTTSAETNTEDSQNVPAAAAASTDNANTEPESAPAPSNTTISISADPTSGPASLTVSLSASGGNNGYQWNFGDGATASGQSVSHVYSQAGTFTVTLTSTGSDGEVKTATRSIYVFGSSVDNSQVIVPNGVLFYDDFNYSVRRDSNDGLGEREKFLANGWSNAKAINLTGSYAGYMYTVNQIPGYSGPFPGRNSDYVLAIEGRPSTFDTQTDFYLQYGDESGSVGQIPGNVWFQFWMYINNYDDPNDINDQISGFGRTGKFIYPTKSTYPSHDGLWLLGCCTASYQPFSQELGDAGSGMYMHLADYEYLRYTGPTDDSTWKLGQTSLAEKMTPNRWLLVKLHIDTSTVSPSYEQWIKPMGGQWTKTAEWINGVTPNLSWQIPANEVGGHKMIRMPTTINPCRDRSLSCDFWIYMDDFAISNSEDTLPQYPY